MRLCQDQTASGVSILTERTGCTVLHLTTAELIRMYVHDFLCFLHLSVPSPVYERNDRVRKFPTIHSLGNFFSLILMCFLPKRHPPFPCLFSTLIIPFQHPDGGTFPTDQLLTHLLLSAGSGDIA